MNLKKILLLLILTIYIGLEVKAQNMVGSTYVEVEQMLISKNKKYEVRFTSDNVKCLHSYGEDFNMLYFFSTRDICYLYVYTIHGSTLRELEDSLIKHGYVKRGKYLYDSEYKASIIWSDNSQEWFVYIEYK